MHLCNMHPDAAGSFRSSNGQAAAPTGGNSGQQEHQRSSSPLSQEVCNLCGRIRDGALIPLLSQLHKPGDRVCRRMGKQPRRTGVGSGSGSGGGRAEPLDSLSSWDQLQRPPPLPGWRTACLPRLLGGWNYAPGLGGSASGAGADASRSSVCSCCCSEPCLALAMLLGQAGCGPPRQQVWDAQSAVAGSL